MTNINENEVTVKIVLGLLIAIMSMCVIWSIVRTFYDIVTSKDEHRATPTPYRSAAGRSQSHAHSNGPSVHWEDQVNAEPSHV